jgi:anaerobic selenocysteine-containing dehydrogenase
MAVATSADPPSRATVMHRSCPICEASCGLRLEVDPVAKRVLSVRGDEVDPRSRGYVCPKATASQAIHADPDRLVRPLRRTARGFEEVGFEEAYELVGHRLREIRERWGKDAVAVYIGNPIGHSASGILNVPILNQALDTQRLFSAATMDQQPKNLSSRLLYGDYWAIPIPDLDRTDYLLALGGNPRDPERIVLVGRRQMRNMNSWLHNLPALARGRDRCRLLVSPPDAARTGLATGARARVRSRVGELVVPVEVTDEMMPGVVSLPHGFGHSDPETRLAVARAQQPGACSNQLCDEEAMDLPSGTSVANGIPVQVLPV